MKTKILNYFKTTSRAKLAGDIFFYVFIILMLIPVTRREIMSSVQRITMSKPKVNEKQEKYTLNEVDYSFRVEDSKGSNYSLYDFKGEVLFVNFWATWCPPCRAEMPSLQSLYNEYGDKVTFLLITGEEIDPVQKYLNDKKYNLPVYHQKSGLPQAFDVSSIPHTYIINRQGDIIMSKKGAARWDAPEVKTLLDELIAETLLR
jgi:thiol-disulfide isomerase/thioredoxin